MAMINPEASGSLVMVWSSADPEVARKLVFLYSKNSRLRGWWERVRLVAWGPAARLMAADTELQEDLEELKAAGVELLACRTCADLYEVTGRLEALGFEVKFMGKPLTDMLQGGWTCLTF